MRPRVAEPAAERGVTLKAGLVLEVGEHAVENYLEPSRSGGEENLGADVQELGPVERPGSAQVVGEIAALGAVEVRPEHALAGRDDLVQAPDRRRRLGRREQPHRAGLEPTLALELRQPPGGLAHLVGLLDLRQDQAGQSRPDRCVEVPVELRPPDRHRAYEHREGRHPVEEGGDVIPRGGMLGRRHRILKVQRQRVGTVARGLGDSVGPVPRHDEDRTEPHVSRAGP